MSPSLLRVAVPVILGVAARSDRGRVEEAQRWLSNIPHCDLAQALAVNHTFSMTLQAEPTCNAPPFESASRQGCVEADIGTCSTRREMLWHTADRDDEAQIEDITSELCDTSLSVVYPSTGMVLSIPLRAWNTS